MNPRFAIIVSQFNEEITQGLLKGAQQVLEEQKIDFTEADLFPAPGAFEIPLIAQKLARSGRYSGVIGLGCVIKGDTAHFEFISLGATFGLMQSMLATEVPISFGILTTYSDAQALNRSKPNAENKGREAAIACVQTFKTLKRIESLGK